MRKAICLIMSMIFVGSLFSFGSISCSAAQIEGNNYLNTPFNNDENIVEVDSEFSLIKNININNLSKNKNLKLVLTQDIELHKSLSLSSDVDIDLNGYKIILKNSNASLIVGKQTLVSTIPYQVYHEGHFEKKSKVSTDYNNEYYYGNVHGNLNSFNKSETVTYEDIWVPGYYKTEFRYVYEYSDDVCVNICNGQILGKDACCAPPSKNAFRFSEACGKNGTSPATLFKLVSGNLFLKNVKVKSGNGGDGGDATYSAICHIPLFGGGDGGNGGNGGNGGKGGDLFFSDKGKVFVDKNCVLKVGRGGKGGKGSKCNPNYWIFKGSDGHDGNCGQDGTLINYESRIVF